MGGIEIERRTTERCRTSEYVIFREKEKREKLALKFGGVFQPLIF
jgi:hypothetical protein